MLAVMLAKGAIVPKQAKELTATFVDKLKADGTKNRRVMVGPSDCAGLHLRIEGRTKSWALRIKVGEKRRDIGLGPYQSKIGLTDEEAAKTDGLSLSEARIKARQLRREYRETGTVVTPTAALAIQARAKLEGDANAKIQAVTFKACAERAIDKRTENLKSAKHVAQWSATLKQYAYPTLADIPVGMVTKHDILTVLEPIWNTKHETANRLRGRLEAVLDFAKGMGYREGDNPAQWKGNLDALLPKVKRKPKHQPSLPHARIGSFMAELRKREALAARALEFAILTAARSGEVLGAEWKEIDLQNRVWTIPEERMKAGQEHEIPLSDEAVALLSALPRIKGVGVVFPAPQGGKFSDMALSMLIRRMNSGTPTFLDRFGEPVVPHGFRSTFRDWAGEMTAHSREVIEHALAHRLPDKAERAYQRSTLLPKRARLMADWAKRCNQADETSANVVSIRGAA